MALALRGEFMMQNLRADELSRPTQSPNRRRIVSAGILGLVAVLGLGSRRFASILPHAIAAYTGDTAWALAVFVGLALLFPRLSTRRCAGLSLIISYLVEFSQLYHAAWIDRIRDYSLGHLALGSGFDAVDLVCYTVGAVMGVIIDRCRRPT